MFMFMLNITYGHMTPIIVQKVTRFMACGLDRAGTRRMNIAMIKDKPMGKLIGSIMVAGV